MDQQALGSHFDAATDVLRVEARDFYASSSDFDWPAAYLRGDPPPDIEAKRPWLDRLAAAARSGRPRRRLRAVARPVPDYVRYSAEWGYVDNVAAGEHIKILDMAARPEGYHSASSIGDVYIVDGDVIAMNYDERGRFQYAEQTRDPERARIASELWAFGQDFTEWWAANPDLHRDVQV